MLSALGDGKHRGEAPAWSATEASRDPDHAEPNGSATGTVALTTGLVGAGGFGKTTLAARVCRDQMIRRRFRGGVVWVTIGRDLAGAALAERISEVSRNLGGQESAFASPEQAGQALAALLAAEEEPWW